MAAAGLEDEDYVYIQHLLDTLQCENEPQKSLNGDNDQFLESSVEDPHEISNLVDFSNQPSLGLEFSYESCDVLLGSSVVNECPKADTEVEGNKWNKLLSRFCEDGDEDVLDALLDNFLTSKSDAAMLVEALSSSGPCKSQASSSRPRQALNAHLHLNLNQLQLPDVCQKDWEALLDSARDLLRSSRTPSRSPCSLPAPPPLLEIPCYAGPGMDAGESHSCTPGHALEISEVADALPAELRSPTARAEFLAKIAEMDGENHEVARTFMRRFFMGVRQRLASTVASGSDSDEDEEDENLVDDEEQEEEESAESNAITNPSEWSCESVVTMSLVG